jgi:aminomethyltransferase
MKKTAIYDQHIALGAKMVPFAGYEMPVSYEGINAEHAAVRENVGIFDVSHMGEFIIKGKEALDLVQKVTCNDASKLSPGGAQYSCLTNHQGGIVDDLIVYRLGQDQCNEGEMAFMLVVNAANIEKDFNWIQQQNTFDTRFINISDQTGLLAIQGPRAQELLQHLTEISLPDISYYHFEKGFFAGYPNVLISNTGYTGAGGFEIYADVTQIAAIWEAILNAGGPLGIQPIGLGARDTLRLEMGYCLYGNDIDDHTSPLAAGLGWVTKLNKGNFIGRTAIEKIKAEGVKRKLIGFTLTERRVPRNGYPILDEEGTEIGVVTSGTQSPTMGHPIGMGYVDTPLALVGQTIWIGMGSKKIAAQIVRPPFIKKP